MKKIKTALLALFTFSLAFSLVSCGQNPAGNTEQVNVNSADYENAEEKTETTEAFADLSKTIETKAGQFAEFEVTSEDLSDGLWAPVITDTKSGSNVSPQLSWAPVEGASSYVVYMVDTSAQNWLHWKSGNLTETKLEQGSAKSNEYVGPYPPPGKPHTYEIWVYALESQIDKVPGKFNQTNYTFEDYLTEINDASKVIAVGHLSGDFTDTGE